ncbi:MAG: hypothetical protein Q8Q07_01780 [Dehalococcoidales bacterium]|nr:hypothetical protein [Dehalococcoidales bacterium]MDZ4230910.1 hypothetical protein [Dehalococcoidales bacterium]
MKRHFLVGISGAVLLILVYLGLIALAQDWTHALQQTASLWYWVVALSGGFGVQAGLFSFIRQSIRERKAAATGSVAASGGVSAGSMAACCAHHLSDVLPLMGLSGAAIFLVRYQLFFIVAGVLSNIIGITIMLETIQHHGLSQRLAQWWNMNRVKKGAMASAVAIIAVTFILTSL